MCNEKIARKGDFHPLEDSGEPGWICIEAGSPGVWQRPDVNNLESIRKKLDLSIVAFTNLLPIQRSTYYGWLTGRRRPDPYRMKACLKIAGKMK
jgi:hypothetical protein